MDAGSFATWVQAQGSIIKAMAVVGVLILAGLAIAFILKTPDRAKVAPSVPVPHNVDNPPPMPNAEKQNSNPASVDKKDSRGLKSRIDVKSYNQSGGITAGEIHNVRVSDSGGD